MLAPPWIALLSDAVALSIQPTDDDFEIGSHYCQVGDVCEISIFGLDSVIYGGKRDGQMRSLPFIVDLAAVRQLFTKVDHCTWQAQSFGDTDELGPHVSIEGVMQGHSVWLRILANAPKFSEAVAGT
jgi:hypothetical protein